MDLQRYSRQMVFKYIGEEGQTKLLHSRVAIIGLGALGTVIANNLCRSGVGFLRLIDRDYVELTNLQRQTLFSERDAAEQIPKVIAASDHLTKVNADVIIDPIIADVNSSNIESLIKDTDLVLDGTDNAEVRYLINEACHKTRIPWIYGGALGSTGMTINVLYDDGPCFRCFRPVAPVPGSSQTCSTAGVLNMITGIIASVESAEAIKILIGSPKVRKNLFLMSIWDSESEYIEIKKNPDCPTCVHGAYEFLGKLKGSYTTSLCGRDSVQVIPGSVTTIDFNSIADKLEKIGTVKQTSFMLSYEDPKTSFSLFPDGRAIIRNVKDEMAAKSIYSEYIGL